MRELQHIRWKTLIPLLVVFVLISVGLAYGIQTFITGLHLPLAKYKLLTYLIIFGIALITNVSFVPIPVLLSIMIVAAANWNPVAVALWGSLGASLGEFSGYYAGLIAKKVAIPDTVPTYKRINGWIDRYGVWAITFLSFQPILPIEVGAFIAGTVKMPVYKFLPALWLGKFPKYIILILAGATITHILPSLF